MERIPSGSHNDVVILVPSWDGYQDVWQPFFHCFFKYWPDCPYPVFLGSNYRSYPDARVSSIAVGYDVDFSSNLLIMLNRIEQDWVITWNEDAFLSKPVNTSRIRHLVNLAQRDQAAYLKLIAFPPFVVVDDVAQEIGEAPKGTEYRVSFTTNLWKKSALLKLLCPGETAWDFERKGSQRSNELEDKFLCLSFDHRKNPPLSVVHGVIKGRWTREAVRFLKREGLQDYLGTRPRRPYWAGLWIRAYYLRLDLLCQLQRWQRQFCRMLRGKAP